MTCMKRKNVSFDERERMMHCMSPRDRGVPGRHQDGTHAVTVKVEEPTAPRNVAPRVLSARSSRASTTESRRAKRWDWTEVLVNANPPSMVLTKSKLPKRTRTIKNQLMR